MGGGVMSGIDIFYLCGIILYQVYIKELRELRIKQEKMSAE
jgi:hypothetical protein